MTVVIQFLRKGKPPSASLPTSGHTSNVAFSINHVALGGFFVFSLIISQVELVKSIERDSDRGGRVWERKQKDRREHKNRNPTPCEGNRVSN